MKDELILDLHLSLPPFLFPRVLSFSAPDIYRVLFSLSPQEVLEVIPVPPEVVIPSPSSSEMEEQFSRTRRNRKVTGWDYHRIWTWSHPHHHHLLVHSSLIDMICVIFLSDCSRQEVRTRCHSILVIEDRTKDSKCQKCIRTGVKCHSW